MELADHAAVTWQGQLKMDFRQLPISTLGSSDCHWENGNLFFLIPSDKLR